VQEVTIPLPRDIREVFKDARKFRTSRRAMLPPTVRKSYRVPREDWAFLGAVRRPDRILESYSKTKKNSKGLHHLQDANHSSLASAFQDAVQSSAHTVRPVSASYQSAAAIYDMSLHTQQLLQDGDFAQVRDNLQRMALMAQYSLTASIDAADCLARFNSDSACRLRSVWIDHSRLPDDIKDAVRIAPIVEGTVPAERGREFTAPIVGEALKSAHEQAYSRAKADKLLSQKSASMQKPQQQAQKRRTTAQSPTTWKRPRRSPQRPSQAARPAFQQHQGRGTQRNRGGRDNHRQGSNQRPNQPKSAQPGQGGKPK
jgi:hypothetical protein